MKTSTWCDALFPASLLHLLPDWVFPRNQQMLSSLSHTLYEKVLAEAFRRRYWPTLQAALQHTGDFLYGAKKLPLLTGQIEPATLRDQVLLAARSDRPIVCTEAWALLPKGPFTTGELSLLTTELLAAITKEGAWKNVPRLTSYLAGVTHAVVALTSPSEMLPSVLRSYIRETLAKVEERRLPWVKLADYKFTPSELFLTPPLFKYPLSPLLVEGLSDEQKVLVFQTLTNHVAAVEDATRTWSAPTVPSASWKTMLEEAVVAATAS